MITQRSGCLTTVLTLFLLAGVALAFAIMVALQPAPVVAQGACDGQQRNQFGHCND